MPQRSYRRHFIALCACGRSNIVDYAGLLSLNMQNIQIFLTVASLGNMTKAAAVLNVTQPLLSQRIHRMEDSLGVTLFERTPHKMQLTAAGEYLYSSWGQLFAQISSSIETAQEIQRGVHTHLNFGIYGALGNTAKYNLSKAIMNAFPDLQIDLPNVPLYEIADQLYNGKVDVVLVPDYENYSAYPDIETLTVGYWPLFALVNLQNPLADRKSVTWAELQDQIWLSNYSNANSGYEKALIDCARKAGFAPDIRHYTGDDTVRFYLQLNRGIAIVMSYYLQDNQTGTTALEIRDSQFPLILAWKKDVFAGQNAQFAAGAAKVIRDSLRLRE